MGMALEETSGRQHRTVSDSLRLYGPGGEGLRPVFGYEPIFVQNFGS
jgi:hypothetical protein